MRTLSATLLAIQKLGRYKPLVKVSLTYSGSAGYEYTTKSANRIIDINHSESPDKQNTEIIIDNADKTLTDIALKGYKAVVSWGATTGAGDEYSACAPLWVIAQRIDSWQGGLVCRLSLAGIPNVLHEEKAIDNYTPATDDTKTVKTLIREIAGDTGVSFLWPYMVYPHYDVVFDSEDSLIDTFMPKDSFRIRLNDRRWDKLGELLDLTGCVKRIEDDEDIHIFVPTISGSSYDYEYKLLVVGEHTFFNKSYRKRLVMPNYVTVKSHSTDPDDVYYLGSASDSSSLNEIGVKYEDHLLRLTSDAQAAAIAAAILAGYKLDAEGGSAVVPMNFGAEVYDYNKFTDSRAGDSVTGNIGYLNRSWDVMSGKMPTMRVALGKPRLAGWLGTIASLASSAEAQSPLMQTIIDILEEIITYLEEQRKWGLIFQSVFTTHGDILYRGALEAQRLPPDAGKGYNFLRSRGTGLSPVWEDIEDLIIYITGGANRTIALDLAIPAATITPPLLAVDASGGAETITKALTAPIPTVGHAQVANTPGAVGGAVADDGGAQTDETTEANSAAADDMTLLPATPVVDDAYYFGKSTIWDFLALNIGTAGDGVWTITWEYWNGSAWTALTVHDTSNGFRASGLQSVAFGPGVGEQTAVNGVTLYWIRARVSAYTSIVTQPTGTQAWAGAH